MAAPAPPTLHVVLFSKDRAFQLRECLQSVRRHVRGRVLVSVLYAASSPAVEDAYRAVAGATASNEGHASVSPGDAAGECRMVFHRETSFAEDVRALLASSSAPFLTFLVDDALFLRDVSVEDARRLLAPGKRVAAWFLKLHPGVSYSHPASRRCWPPRLEYAPGVGNQCAADVGRGVALWSLADAGGDWAYLWDFCGTVYPAEWATCVVGRVLDRLAAAGTRVNPNSMEAEGNKLLHSKEGAGLAPGEGARGACPAQRAMTVLAVNRVQQTYTVPTYAAEPGTPDLLLPSLVHTHRIDTRRLAAVPAATVHVGSPPLVEGAATPLPPPPLLPPDSVTVVMPARNAAATVGRAMRSVLRQRGAPRFRLVVLDDGSTDGTAAAVTAAAAECEAGLEGEGRGGAGVPEVRVVRRGQEGRHSAALAGDALLLEVGSPWFARIDADDSWDEHHLQRLCGAAEAAGPAQHVVGTQVVRASGEQTRVLPLPCDPLHVLFSALFYCPIAHSGALVRTQTAVEAGGYTGTLAAATSGVGAARAADTVDTVSVDARVGTAGASSSGAEAGGYTGTLAGAIDTTGSTAAASEVVAGTGGDVDTADGAAAASSSGAESGEGVVAEDYGLWTRVLARYPLGVSNLSDALTTLHRHGGNLSSVHASLLERRGDDVAAAFARAFVARDSGDKEQDKEEEDGPISLRAIAVLRRPESASSLHDLDQASAALERWEAAVLAAAGPGNSAVSLSVVRAETSARLGELAVLALQSPHAGFGALTAGAFRRWLTRCPDEARRAMAGMLCPAA